MAVSIERCYYDLDSDYVDSHFTAVFDSVGLCDFYTPGGYMYRLLHGFPSGVKATSTLNSIINFVMQIYFTLKVNQKRMNYAIGGDDLLRIFFLKANNIISYMERRAYEIGWEFKFLVEKKFSADSYDDRPIFFKYTLDDGEPVVPAKAVYERIMCPWNKNYNSNIKIYNFLLDVIPSLGALRTHLIMFYKYFQYIYKSAFNETKDLKSIYLLHDYYYREVVNKILRPKLYGEDVLTIVKTSLIVCNFKVNSKLNEKVFIIEIILKGLRV